MLGYLGMGAALGPYGLGSLRADLGLFHWLTISDAKGVAGIAELGVVFLLFMIGLELSYGRLQAMRRLVFGLGSLQVARSTGVLAALAALFGVELAPSIIIGGCLALSSTAIVVEVLAGKGRLATVAGRTSLAVLGAGFSRRAPPAFPFHSQHGNWRFGLDGSCFGGCKCFPWPWPDRPFRPRFAQAVVQARRIQRRKRAFHGGDFVCHCGNGRGGELGGVIHGDAARRKSRLVSLLLSG